MEQKDIIIFFSVKLQLIVSSKKQDINFTSDDTGIYKGTRRNDELKIF